MFHGQAGKTVQENWNIEGMFRHAPGLTFEGKKGFEYIAYLLQ